MTKTAIRTQIPMEGVTNIRHLGGYPGAAGTTSATAFIRSESPSSMTTSDIGLLLFMGVRTVVDLRSCEEVSARPNPFAAIPLVHYHHIPIFENEADMDFFNATPRGRSYCWILDKKHSQQAYKRVLHVLASAEGTALYHCAVGKDRTGILSALLLLLADVPEAVVCEEYSYTQTLLAPWVQREIDDAPAGEAEHIRTLHGAFPEYMAEAIDHLNRRYGGVTGYLRAIGLAQEQVQNLSDKMLAIGDQIRRIPA